MGTLESQLPAETVLYRIAKLSAHNPDKKFHSLMHHINVDSLRACFHELDGKKAVGIDGVTKASYGENLEANLVDLIARMKRMAYRPGPVREVLIPKEGKVLRTKQFVGYCFDLIDVRQKNKQHYLLMLRFTG